MPATPAVLRLSTLAVVGLLALTACAGPDAGTPSAVSGTRSDTAPTATAGSPSTAHATTTASPSPDLARAPLGTHPYEVRTLTVADRPVAVPAGVTIALSPDARAFQAATTGLCGQPRWGVVVVDPAHWSLTGDVPQTAEGCAPDTPGHEARAALDRLAEGAAAVTRGAGGTLTLTRDDLVLELAPQG